MKAPSLMFSHFMPYQFLIFILLFFIWVPFRFKSIASNMDIFSNHARDFKEAIVFWNKVIRCVTYYRGFLPGTKIRPRLWGYLAWNELRVISLLCAACNTVKCYSDSRIKAIHCYRYRKRSCQRWPFKTRMRARKQIHKIYLLWATKTSSGSNCIMYAPGQSPCKIKLW